MSPPKCSMSRSPVAVSTAPAPKNSRLLIQRMIEHVQEARGERGGPRREAQAVGLECERQAEADEDDPDILHRVIGEAAA